MIKSIKKTESSRLSILLVPDNLASYRMPVFKAIADRGQQMFELTVACDSKTSAKGPRLANLNNVTLPFKIEYLRSLYFRKLCLWQTGLLKKILLGDHDVIILWGEAHRLSTWMAGILSRILGKTVMIWGHGIYGREGRIKLFLRKNLHQLAHGVITYNNWGRERLMEAGISGSSIFPIWNSLDFSTQDRIYNFLEKQQSTSKSVGNTETIRLCWIGRLARNKRLDLVISAAALLKQKGHLVELYIVGAGPEEEALRRQAHLCQIEAETRFLGSIHDEEIIAPILYSSTVCVSPGNIGLTAVHSLTYGVPVVSHSDMRYQAPEAELIIEGLNGYTFKRGDINDLAEKILKTARDVCNGKITRSGCRKLIIEHYNPTSQAEIFVHALTSSVKRLRQKFDQ